MGKKLFMCKQIFHQYFPKKRTLVMSRAEFGITHKRITAKDAMKMATGHIKLIYVMHMPQRDQTLKYSGKHLILSVTFSYAD